MIKRSIVISVVIVFMVFGSVVMSDGSNKQKRKRLPGKGEYVPIAKINPESGKIKIRERILRKEFADGGKIERFEIKQFIDGYNLLRMGKNKDGSGHVEALPLKMKANVLLFGPLKWFVTCDLSAQNCENNAFCMANYDKTACECPDGTDCTIGRGGAIGIDTVLVENFDYPGR